VVDVISSFAALNDSSGAPDFSSLSPFNSASQFHPECLITDPNNQTNVEQCWIGDAAFPLPDLNTEDSGIVQTMNSWIQSLVQTYNVDGIRIDAAKHIRTDFWPEFVSSAGVFSIGEVSIMLNSLRDSCHVDLIFFVYSRSLRTLFHMRQAIPVRSIADCCIIDHH
jgi:alpha-amylase